MIAIGATLQHAVGEVVPVTAPHGLVILPSSLSRRDQLAATVRSILRVRGVATSLAVPDTALAAIPGLANESRWRSVDIVPADRRLARIRLPSRLVDAPEIWTVTDVDAVSGRGPFVLDLLGRYASPLARLRFLTDRARAGVEVNLAVSVSWHIMYRAVDGFVVAAATSDPIAAELLALSLAEENLPADRSVEGVWEDRVVQRATELELGIQTPLHLGIELRVPGHFPEALPTVARLALRMGVAFP